MEELDVSMFQSLPLPMRESLTRQGIPNLLSQEEAAVIRLNAGDESVQPQPVMSAQQAGVQPGDQVGPEAMPLPVDPYNPTPAPESGQPEPAPTPSSDIDTSTIKTDTGALDELESDIDKILELGGLTFERQKELLEMKGRIALERDTIQARTQENIRKYEANARREAEIAKALTFVAYKANRPDAELVGQLMSPMSGMSSLYQSRGPVPSSNVETGRVK